jgi:hypothetical protein
MPVAHLLPAVTLAVVAGCFSSAITAGLRASGAARRSLRAQLTASAAYAIGGTGGAILAGAAGTCWGVTASHSFSAIVCWYQLRSALADHHQMLEVAA